MSIKWRPKPQPPVEVRPITVVVLNTPNLNVRLESPAGKFIGAESAGGFYGFPSLPASMATWNFFIEDDDDVGKDNNDPSRKYKFYGIVITLPSGGHQLIVGSNPIPVPPLDIGMPSLATNHFDPASITLDELRKFRGALYTARANVGQGPRPYQPSNVCAMDYYDTYQQNERDIMVEAYKARNYTDCCYGPLIDPGYHGQYAATDYRGNFDVYLDTVQELYDQGIRPTNFILPLLEGITLVNGKLDIGLCNTNLRPLFSDARCQALFRKVCLAWEPNDGLGPDSPIAYNSEWITAVKWLADVFPNALRYIHMAPDHDAPGGSFESIGGGTMWRNVAPYIHGYMPQFGGYDAGLHPFMENVTATMVDLYKRFTTGYADWPTFSAYGPSTPLDLVFCEYASYWDYWQNRLESEAISIGDSVMKTGCVVGYFDGGSL